MAIDTDSETYRPVEDVHELVFAVGDTEVHDSVEQVNQERWEITVKCQDCPLKVVTAGDIVNLRQQNLYVQHTEHAVYILW